jgi:TatA/E family protein of Tat protein translocase
MPRGPELLIIVAVLFVLFGASRLPQLGSSIGSFVKNLKKGLAGEEPTAEKKLADGSGEQVQPADKAVQKQG